jgi:hypothetical protein
MEVTVWARQHAAKIVNFPNTGTFWSFFFLFFQGVDFLVDLFGVFRYLAHVDVEQYGEYDHACANTEKDETHDVGDVFHFPGFFGVVRYV